MIEIGTCIADRMVFDIPDSLVVRHITHGVMVRITRHIVVLGVTDRVLVRRITHGLMVRIIDMVFQNHQQDCGPRYLQYGDSHYQQERPRNQEQEQEIDTPLLQVGHRPRRPPEWVGTTPSLPWLIGKKGKLSRLSREMKILHNSLLQYLAPFEEKPASMLSGDLVQISNDESGESQRAMQSF